MRENVERGLEALVVLGALATIPLTIAQERGIAEAWTLLGDWIVWAIFFVEYTAMIYMSADHKGYALRHWYDAGIVVLSFPALPAMLALVRLARLVRLTRLMRLVIVTARGARALRVVLGRPGLVYIAGLSGLVVLAASALMVMLEPETVGGQIWGALWWSVVTVTTVGYGDIAPVTFWGRIAGVMLMFAGLGLVSTLAATIAAYFVDMDNDAEFQSVEDRLERIEGLLKELAQDR